MTSSGVATAASPSGRSAFLDRYAQAFGRNQSLLLRLAGLGAPEVSGSGAYVEDAEGRRWLDFGSFGVHLLGHLAPEICDAAATELGRMGLSTKILGNSRALECAEKIIALTRSLPEPLDTLFFTNSGAEANECALRIASLATGRRAFAALKGAYHGKSLGCAALTDSTFRSPAAERALAVKRLPRGDIAAAERALADGSVAALFIELIQGEGGIYQLDRSFVHALQALCKRTGTMLIVDEVQTGLGRAGSPLLSGEYGIRPDILTLGKVLGGGLLPIAATMFCSRQAGAAATDPVVHSSSFAGGALATAVASRVVDIVAEKGFLEAVADLAARARARLDRLPLTHRSIVDVRGAGLMIGIEFASASACGEVVLEAAKRNLLLTFCLNEPTVLRVYPPAILSPADLHAGLDSLEAAILAAEAKV